LIKLATKNIVPRSTGEGTLGTIDKHWGAIYVDSFPLVENSISTHNSSLAHSNGISGNAATATKLASPVTINGISFDGSANITIPVPQDDFLTDAEIEEIFENA
jgi:hypothetical protein